MTDRPYDDIADAPRTSLSHTGRTLNGYRVEGVIYAPSLKEAQVRLNCADIYLDHARIVKWEQEEMSDGNGHLTVVWEPAGHDEEPRDQQAHTITFDHGYWDLGPSDSGWTVTLVRQDEDLSPLREWTWAGVSESRVKDIADYIENGVAELRRINGDQPRLIDVLVAEWISSALWLPHQ